MGNVTRRALRVYAALSEFKDTSGEDVLDALIPFFEPILDLMNGKVFDPRLFALAVQKLYRWQFNPDIAEHFIPRLERKGYLKRHAHARGKSAYIVTFSSPTAPTNELPINELLKRVIDEFEQFPPRVSDLLTYQRTREELTDILIGFLVSLDAYRDAQLVAEVNRLQTRDDESLLSQLEDGGALDHDDRYMAARFVQYLCKERAEYVPDLTRLASIGLLTEVVQDFVKPVQPAKNINLTVLVDAPLVTLPPAFIQR